MARQSRDAEVRSVHRMFRYPIKGFTPEEVQGVKLEPGAGFPNDRVMAISDGTWSYSPSDYVPKFKDKFLALMTHPKLALLKTASDAEARGFTVTSPDGQEFRFDVDRSGSEAEFLEFLSSYLDLPATQKPELLRRDGSGEFSDIAAVDCTGTIKSAVSMMNLASVRDLEEKMGSDLDVRRLRANIYYESEAPWEEADWGGRYVRVGSAIGKVVWSTPRCIVTAVNPDTGERDRGVPQSLLRHYRHKNLGFYIDIVEPGEVRLGDRVEVVEYERETHKLIDVPFNGTQFSIYVKK